MPGPAESGAAEPLPAASPQAVPLVSITAQPAPPAQAASTASTRELLLRAQDGYLRDKDAVTLLLRIGWNAVGMIAVLAVVLAVIMHATGARMSEVTEALRPAVDLSRWPGWVTSAVTVSATVFGGVRHHRKKKFKAHLDVQQFSAERLRRAMRFERDEQPPS